jgi:hypothetical protein
MRETVIPVLPNFEYCMISPNIFLGFRIGVPSVQPKLRRARLRVKAEAKSDQAATGAILIFRLIE